MRVRCARRFRDASFDSLETGSGHAHAYEPQSCDKLAANQIAAKFLDPGTSWE
jgi:hypothetical protein